MSLYQYAWGVLWVSVGLGCFLVIVNMAVPE